MATVSRAIPAFRADGPGRTDCNVSDACLKRATTFESAEMSQITQLEAQLAEAFDRLRAALAARAAAAAPQPGERPLRDRIAALENEKAELADELGRLGSSATRTWRRSTT